VSSELGQGSTFRFDIQAEVVDPSAVQTAHPTRRVVGLEQDQRTYRLLIVDDKAVNRNLLVKMLKPLGFEVRAAADGQEAIESWESWDPHLIWMDMRMPVMDGYEATRRIKATTKGQATVIIALTASALEEDRAVTLSEGCDGYMRKPFREADLFEMLSKHLGVRFLYEDLEDRKPDTPGEYPQEALTSVAGQPELVEELAALPADLVTDLKRATVQADWGLILSLIDQIRGQNEALADVLTDLANDFEYRDILTLIQLAESRA